MYRAIAPLANDYLAPVIGARNTHAFNAGLGLYDTGVAVGELGRYVKSKYWKGSNGKTVTKTVTGPSTIRRGRWVSRPYRNSNYKRYRRMPKRRFKMRRRYRRRYGRVSKKARWQARARRHVGAPKGFSTSKTTESVLPNERTVAKMTVDAQILNNIGTGTSNDINDRTRYTAFISGIKIDATFINQASTRIYINWAIVHGKQGQTPGPAAIDFFRDYTDTRAWNADATTKTGLSWSVAQINTDEFLVLKRGKFLLTPLGGNSVLYNIKAATKELSHWLKLRRQFMYDESVNTAQDKLYFVCWGSDPQDAAAATGTAFKYRLRAVTYFRDPRGA